MISFEQLPDVHLGDLFVNRKDDNWTYSREPYPPTWVVRRTTLEDSGTQRIVSDDEETMHSEHNLEEGVPSKLVEESPFGGLKADA